MGTSPLLNSDCYNMKEMISEKILADHLRRCKEGVSSEVAISMPFHGTPTLAGCLNIDLKSNGVRDQNETERIIQN
jgi:hypothetical protein